MFATQQKSQRSSLHSLDTLLWKMAQPDDHQVLASSLEMENMRQKIEVKPSRKAKTNAGLYLAQKSVQISLILECIYHQLWHFMTHCSVCQCPWLCRKFEPL